MSPPDRPKGEYRRAEPEGTPVNAGLRRRFLLAAPGVALAAVTVAVALAGHEADRWSIAVQAAAGLVVVWSVAAAVALRYPNRPMGQLLFALAILYVPMALQSTRHPWLLRWHG
jgi:hypothetical protein